MKRFLTLLAAWLAVAATSDAQYLPANRNLSNLLNNTAVNSSLVPMNMGKLNLGSAMYNWNDFHFSGKIYKKGISFLSSDSMGGTFVGMAAGSMNTGGDNTAIGDSAMYHNIAGGGNTATGSHALYTATECWNNSAYGWGALYSNTWGWGNGAHGYASLHLNTTGFLNLASGGYGTLYNNTEGSVNTAVGGFAMVRNTTGWGNTGIGQSALWTNETNHNNTGLGNEAAGNSYDYSNATFLGVRTNADSGLTNITALGYEAYATASNQVMVGNSAVTSIGGYTNWSNFSDGRYKKNVKENVPGLSFITQLRPVTYTLDVNKIENAKGIVAHKRTLDIPGLTDKNPYARQQISKAAQQTTHEEKAKTEKEKIIQTGFIAQEVEAAAKKLDYHFSGVDKPTTKKGFYALRYGDFIVPLVKAVQEQQQQIAAQQKEIDELKTLVQSLTKQPASTATPSSAGAALLQNNPNPFSQSTIIKYSIPSNAISAQIILTDMQGNVLRTFNPAKGDGQISLESNDLPSAIYNYTLLVNGKTVNTRQMVVAK